MFRQNNDKKQDNQIPEDSINGTMSADNNQQNFGHPGVPLVSSQPSSGLQDDSTQQLQDNNPPAQVFSPGQANDQPTEQPTNTPNPASNHHEPASKNDKTSDTQPQQPASELDAIKQKALNQLSPLVDHLDQSPEDKFRTTMMMIQASDDQNLIQSAYEAAEQIPDEKVRAQALLDVVNEINYFTQQKQ